MDHTNSVISLKYKNVRTKYGSMKTLSLDICVFLSKAFTKYAKKERVHAGSQGPGFFMYAKNKRSIRLHAQKY